MTITEPTSVLLDRAAGTLVGLAAGDALGAGYEMTTPSEREAVDMIGGGLGDFAPGEWTDDTAQAVAIARVTAKGAIDLDAIGSGFLDWFAGFPPDCGISTGAVLRAVGRSGTAAELTEAARQYFMQHPKGAAGNGALMRTAAVALAHLGDDQAIAAAAMEVAALTHGDPLAGEGCVLWCIAIDRAIRHGRLDGVRDGLGLLPEERRARWTAALDEAEVAPPRSLRGNGFVVRAVQAAHAAITQTPVPDDQPGRHLALALVNAVRIGGDTDTVAAIAGMLLGARYGVSAVPGLWRSQLHGWPGMDADDLVRLAISTVRGGGGDAWPDVRHMPTLGEPLWVATPWDSDLLVGNLAGIGAAVDADADVVVSLCRTGRDDVPAGVEQVTVWLPDTDDPAQNPNLSQVLEDTVDVLIRRRAEGLRVFLHCAAGASRTPTLAALYAARIHGIDAVDAFEALRDVLPVDGHNRRFAAARGAPLPDRRFDLDRATEAEGIPADEDRVEEAAARANAEAEVQHDR